MYSILLFTLLFAATACDRKSSNSATTQPVPSGSSLTEPASPAAAVPSTNVELRIAAAADLKGALDSIASEFHQAHPEVTVTPVYGASGSFFAQLSNKAPFDLFLSADSSYPKKLIEQGLAKPGSEFRYAVGKIVVWVPNGSKLDVEKLGVEALRDASIQHIAIANPDVAPYGRAAVAAMKSRGVYEKCKSKLVMGENVAQAAQFVQSGGAEVGIIAESIATSPVMKQAGHFHIIATDAYPAIEQGGIILPWTSNPGAAKQFKEFLTGPRGKAVLKNSGFSLPEE